MAARIRVGVLMGSDSDLPVMRKCLETLKEFGICHEVNLLSAHRTPDQCAAYLKAARGRGLKVIIAAAGGAAHLAGAAAAYTTLPVIGVPLASTSLQGLDALLSTVQMPPGVPVAAVAIGEYGAVNAAVLAAQILALEDARLARRLAGFKAALARRVAAKDKALRDQLGGA
jgi:phosphoribosylaminoimidazole carboxylase PurE protein